MKNNKKKKKKKKLLKSSRENAEALQSNTVISATNKIGWRYIPKSNQEAMDELKERHKIEERINKVDLL